MIDEPLLGDGRHDTFRPVSILDTGMGLGINEDEFNFDMNGRASLGGEMWDDYNR
jgi:hypothetical protein